MNNPAQRLLNILEHGKQFGTNQTCKTVWCEILEVEPKSTHMLLGRIGKTMALADEIVSELGKLENVKVERYLAWIPRLETAFSKSPLDQQWGNFINHVDTHVINYLEMTSDLLSARSPQAVLDKDQLDEIKDEALDLLKLIDTSNIEFKLKKYLTDQIARICISIEEYVITGATDIIDIVESTFGKALLHKEIAEERNKSDVGKRFWNFMGKTALAFSVISGPLTIGIAAKDLGLIEIKSDGTVQPIEVESTTESIDSTQLQNA